MTAGAVDTAAREAADGGAPGDGVPVREDVADGHLATLAGGGELGVLLRGLAWERTPLGPPDGWPQSLRTAVRIMLTSRQPIWIGWGPELTYLYNDPYRSIIGGKHPWALGRPTAEVWREIWSDIGPMLATAMGGVEGTYVEEQLLIMERNGYPEETYYTFSYSPIPDDDGRAGGIICANSDDTARVISERQLKLLADLAARTAGARSVPDAVAGLELALGQAGLDLPFALLFLWGDDEAPVLTVACGAERTHPVADPATWPLAEVRGTEGLRVLADLDRRVPAGLPTGGWTQPPRAAVLLPIGGEGVLVVGLNPFRVLDDGYRGFLGLVAAGVASTLAAARGFEEEAARARALAELDRAKTQFFSNVSHEFRTPLTLMLSPIEAVLARPEDGLDAEARALVVLAHRNALRLLKLVNALLDFTRIEAGRSEARFRPTDLATLTADLASTFEAAMERAGLRLQVDCPPLDEPVFVDRNAWEKIVLNLLSNAFKFTFEGGVTVSLGREGGGRAERAVLTVRDTGVGIPSAEMPRVFERFHRVEGQRSRSFEGTGIGLALVAELVRLHGGTIEVDSEPGQGSAFRVALPFGSAHLPPARIAGEGLDPIPAARALPFVTEAEGWLPDAGEPNVAVDDDRGVLPSATGPDGPARLLVADDNADMRAYLRRLLAPLVRVETVANGAEALAAIRAERPDLVLSDVMMPGLDGLGLVRELRADPLLRDLPVILLSARAGEEARVEGLGAGADDYLPKPFAARELVARVRANLDLARRRGEAQAVLEGLAARKAFLVDLGDALRPIEDPERIALTAAGLLGRHLGVARCGYGAVDEATWVVTVAGDWTDGRMPSAAGTYHLDAYGPELAARLARGEAVVVDDLRADPSIGHAEAAAYEGMGGLRAALTFPLFKNGAWAASLYLHDVRPRAWAEADIDLAREVAERTWAAIETARARTALREGEARFRNMADHAPVMVWTTSPEGRCTYLNRRWYEFTGQTEEEARGFGWLAATHPDDAPEAERIFRAANAAARPFQIEYRLRRADGTYAWAIDAAAPRLSDDGRFLGYVGSVIDITERKRAEERQALLVHELNHRVKNTLATVQSLAFQSFRLGRVDDAVREAFEARLLLLSRAHDVLTVERWEGAGLAEIAARALAPFDADGRITRQGPALRLPPRVALAIAMALHELATNAVKYGALSDPAGRVDLTWEVLPPGTPSDAAPAGAVNPTRRRLALSWVESGGPAVSPPKRRGFGSRLIEGGLADEIEGEVRIDFRPMGVTCRLVAPLPEEGSR